MWIRCSIFPSDLRRVLWGGGVAVWKVNCVICRYTLWDRTSGYCQLAVCIIIRYFFLTLFVVISVYIFERYRERMQLCLTSLWTSLTFLQLFLFEPVWPFSDYFSLNQSDLSPSISLSISLIFPQLFLFQPVWSFFCYFPLIQSDLSLVISLLTSLIFLQLFYRLFEPIDVSKIIQMVLVILCTVLRFIELRVMEIICLHYIPQFVILFTEKKTSL